VVAGGLDAACGTLGAGVLHNGETQEQGGQAGGMSICTDHYSADPRLILSYHVVPGKWLLQGGTVGGGGVMKWLHAELGGGMGFGDMDEEAARVPAGSDGLIFLPYMSGERSPIWDAKAKGVYYGLDFAKTRGYIIRAGLEGTAFALRHNVEVAERAGAKVERMQAMGGAANSRVWTQIKADITGKPIDVPASDTASTLGAAMLAGVATGVYRDFDEAVAKTVRVTRSHTPQPSNATVYGSNYETYLDLYQNLKNTMQKG
jgi:xylulokinase